MLHYNDRAVRARIIIAGILLPVIVVVPMIIAFYLHEKNTAIQSHLDKAKAVCLTAESFECDQGCEFKPVGANNKDFDLSFSDRRSFDQKYLSGDGPKDFYLIDDSKQLLCYTAFIRARKSCLDCHGDPFKSKKLWVGEDKSKAIPAHLSGFKEGDICGAYEVISPLWKDGTGASGATFIAGIMLLAGISIYSISFFAVVSYVLNQDADQQKEAICADWQIYDPGPTNKELSSAGKRQAAIID
ncbi:MAG: DUF3365 domain-containing protein [Planctomycetes bacterium]|nr:DUF3365 domain-containing protein [Planctomycetota bacterium]